jgi:hypothetical protein
MPLPVVPPLVLGFTVAVAAKAVLDNVEFPEGMVDAIQKGQEYIETTLRPFDAVKWNEPTSIVKGISKYIEGGLRKKKKRKDTTESNQEKEVKDWKLELYTSIAICERTRLKPQYDFRSYYCTSDMSEEEKQKDWDKKWELFTNTREAAVDLLVSGKGLHELDAHYCDWDEVVCDEDGDQDRLIYYLYNYIFHVDPYGHGKVMGGEFAPLLLNQDLLDYEDELYKVGVKEYEVAHIGYIVTFTCMNTKTKETFSTMIFKKPILDKYNNFTPVFYRTVNGYLTINQVVFAQLLKNFIYFTSNKRYDFTEMENGKEVGKTGNRRDDGSPINQWGHGHFQWFTYRNSAKPAAAISINSGFASEHTLSWVNDSISPDEINFEKWEKGDYDWSGNYIYSDYSQSNTNKGRSPFFGPHREYFKDWDSFSKYNRADLEKNKEIRVTSYSKKVRRLNDYGTFEIVEFFDAEGEEIYANSFCETIHKARRARSVLLYGPPGTGKTSLIAEYVATRQNEIWLNISLGDYRHRPEDFSKLVSFCMETKVVDGIVFEDIDRYTVGNTENLVVSQLLTQIERLRHAVDFLFFTANDAKSLPEAVLRPGRIDQKIEVGPPTGEYLMAYVTYLFESKGLKKDHFSQEELVKICNYAEGLSGTYFNEAIERAIVVGVDAVARDTDKTFTFKSDKL